MRTDSTAIAGVAMGEAQAVIARALRRALHGAGKGRVYKTKAKGAQEAHESIRPTSFLRDPDSLREHLKPDELQAVPADLAARDRVADGAQGARDHDDRARDRRSTACGRRPRRPCSTASPAVYTEGRDDARRGGRPQRCRRSREGDVTTVEVVTPTQHFTEPPPRYTEATLIKALEEHGIGRPSTYAATISTIVDRGYVRVEERRLRPEEIGEIVTDLLVEHFSEYVDLAFTARMEEELDEVARGEREWVPLLREFFGPLKRPGRQGPQGASSAPTSRPRRPTRSAPRATRWSSASVATASSSPARTYPDHKETRPLPGEEAPRLEGDGEPCPQCGEGDARRPSAAGSGRSWAARATRTAPTSRRTARRRPDQLPFEVTCPKNADGQLVARRARRTGNVFWGCSGYPKCDFTTNDEPTGAVHDASDAAHADGRGAVARKGETGICLTCGATWSCRR